MLKTELAISLKRDEVYCYLVNS